MAPAASDDQVYRVVSTAVDAGFYHATNPDVATAGIDAVSHYCANGWREGRDPCPWFSTAAYLQANPDVAAADINPLFHYLIVGRDEGRLARPSDRTPEVVAVAHEDVAPAVLEPSHGHFGDFHAPPEVLALAATGFDAGFYLGANTDVAASGTDPLEHFLNMGWHEGRDPSMGFSLRDYLEMYPDVAASGENPLLHFLEKGKSQGRAPKRSLGFRYDIIMGLRSMDERLKDAARYASRVRPAPVTTLKAALGETRTGLKDLHLTFSHDNFMANLGGVQLCLQREAAHLADRGLDHLNLFPTAFSPAVLAPGQTGLVGVLLNSRLVGHFTTADVVEVLAAIPGGERSLAIHSLLGHAPDAVLEVIAAAGLTAGYFWVHDFASLCTGYTLLRNDVAHCGAPAPDSAACGICIHGQHRMIQVRAHEQLFKALDLIAVAPSQAAMDTWKAGWTYPHAGEIVHPNARLVARKPPRRVARGTDRPFRFAFVGMPAGHKGWPLFREVVIRYAGDPRYQFLHLGSRTEPGLALDFHQVSVSPTRPLAMLETLEALEVDAAMVWSICNETFSLTAYEAIAAGAALITGTDSGNVAALARDGGHGLVLTEAELMAQIETGALLKLARGRRRPQLYDLAYSALTVDLLPERQP